MELKFPLAEAPDAQAAEKGRSLFAGETEFLKGVVAMDGMPPADRVEVCFAGRSNVGKSTLINALTGRKALARASNTPGRTQEINFFTLGDERYLVDLPGYGYANAPVNVVEKWQRLLKAYLSGRANLRRAFVLIDARHGVKPVDSEIMELLDRSAVPFQAVLTIGFMVAITEYDLAESLRAPAAALALAISLAAASIIKSVMLGRILGETVNNFRWGLVIAAIPAALVGWGVTQLPEWVELVVGIPAILATYAVFVWFVGFREDDRVLFRRNLGQDGETPAS